MSRSDREGIPAQGRVRLAIQRASQRNALSTPFRGPPPPRAGEAASSSAALPPGRRDDGGIGGHLEKPLLERWRPPSGAHGARVRTGGVFVRLLLVVVL